MKKISFALGLLGLFVACNSLGDNEYKITGTVKGLQDGKTVILQKQNEAGMGYVSVDTVVIKGEKFEFKGTATEPSIHLLQVETLQGAVPIILEEGAIEVIVNKDTLQNSQVKGTYNNEEFTKFNKESQAISKRVQEKMMAFQQQNLQIFQEAQQKKDTAVINKLIKQNDELGKEAREYFEKYPETHPKAFISALLLEGMTKDPQADFAKIEKIYNSFDTDLKKTKPGKSIELALSGKKKIEVGKPAPDFSAPDPQGKTVSLKKSLGKKATLIDFWASWCRPCRQENPNVVALYNELHDKGFNIVGVSLDKEANDWKEAIQKDGLTWTHLSNLKHWNDPIARQYNINSIPSTLLLDAQGNIVARDLSGEQLKAKVLELLAK